MKRKSEYFIGDIQEISIKHNILHAPNMVYHQERDWTCSIACLRSLLSGVLDKVPSEDEIIEKYRLTPGPHYSKELKSLGICSDLGIEDVLYGCDFISGNKSVVHQDDILKLLNHRFYIMMESMVNYSHWLVLLGYTYSEDREQCQVLTYDPYYNRMRVDIADEFFEMWHDGDYVNSGVHHDFIALK